MIEFLLLACGLFGLWAGSEVLIRGAISIADRFSVSDAIVGMLILAIGTDLPELVVAVDASLHTLAGQDMSGIVMGSAIGSCIGQFALVIGVAGFIGYKRRPARLAPRNSVFLIGGILALVGFSLDGMISAVEGWMLCGFYFLYLCTLFIWKAPSEEPTEAIPEHPLIKDIIFLVVGLAILLYAAELTVVHAVRFAELMGLTNLSVSAVIIGMGSSFPELSVSIIALLKKRGGLSVGNLMGSNVLDTLLVPGVAATIATLHVTLSELWLDFSVLGLVTMMVLGFLYFSPRGVKIPEACALLAVYTGYALLRLTA